MMNEFLAKVIDAHGGMDRWDRIEMVDATVVGGGGLFRLKGMPQNSEPRRLTVWLHKPRVMLNPFGAVDQSAVFTPDRVVVEKDNGTVVAERSSPREAFAGHQMNTQWDPLHQAYFSGEAFWTYFTVPFLLAADGVSVEETEPWREGSETWRVLRARFPNSIETHCLVQEFFFGEDLMLRRHDYSVNVAGGFGAAQLTSEYATANGLRLPMKRRAYTRGADRQPILDMLMVSIDISDVSFT
jgi:hypothetical protein